MDFALLPPEINSARMYAGPGSGPMLASAAAWDGLAAELGSAATSYRSVVSGLAGQWLGPASMAMSAAAAPYVAWMSTTATQAEEAAAQAKAAVTAYETAFAMTVPPPVIAANRTELATLVATNFLGQNAAAIAVTEAHYGEMWAQDAAAMYGYAGSAAAATTLAPFTPPKQNTNPGGLGSQTASVMQATGTSGGTRAQTTVSQLLSGLSQPLQSVSSTSGVGQTAASPVSLLSALTGGSSAGGTAGLGLDTLGLGTDTVGLAGLEVPGLGTEFLGLGLEYQGLGLEYEGLALEQIGASAILGPGAAAASGLGAGLGPLGGLGALGGVGAASAASATAGMGQAVSLGSLSVAAAWTTAAPAAIRQIAMVTSEISAAAPLAVAAGGSELSYGEMAMAGMAGRAMVGPARRGRRERVEAAPSQRVEPPQRWMTGLVTGIAAELRALAELRDSGILTEEEFSQQKQRLLGS